MLKNIIKIPEPQFSGAIIACRYNAETQGFKIAGRGCYSIYHLFADHKEYLSKIGEYQELNPSEYYRHFG